MAKDKKAKAAAKKARVAEKTEKKSARKEKKATSRPKKQDADDDDDDEGEADLDALLASFAQQQQQFLAVTEQLAPAPPSPRSSATLLANPANANELLLFGGEHFNGGLARFFNDLFVYNIARDEWRLITSPNSPLPRSGHAWTRGGNQASTVWLFGGEFSSPKQGTFYHYGDFWRLDCGQSKEWQKMETKGKDKAPPSRSGHRMTYFKQYIILFGGFQDTSSTTKYLHDLWLYDTTTFQWFSPALPPASPKPDPRSSFTFLPHEHGAVMYGGYSRVKTASNSSSSQKGHVKAQTYLKPVVHQDSWFLRIVPPPADKAGAAPPPTVRWERRKKPVNIPQPPRAGATMAHHKGRGIQFGGVHDVEEDEEGIDSEFFNTLGVWNIERNRYFVLSLRRPKQPPRKTPAGARGGGGRGARGKKDEEELLANLRALEMRVADGASEPVPELPEEPAEPVDEDDARPPKPVVWEMPHPRFNAQLAVQDDVLYIFGGTLEKGDREFTFDELWAIDLGKLDGVKEVFRRDLEDWVGEESSDDDDDEDDDDDDDDEEEEEEEQADTPARSRIAQLIADDDSVASPTPTDIGSAPDTEITEPDKEDPFPHPRPFESLRDFYARTSTTWQEVVLDAAARNASQFAERKDIKEIRKEAFDKAEGKWWECREEIQALEDEQEESGIQEVVNLAEKQAPGIGTAGRRR